VRHEDSKLSFLTNGSSIYDDYISFLVARGKTNDALRWADHSRARTLAEGLGLLGKAASIEPPALNAQEVSRRAGGALLFYWVGDKRSYLWAITSRTTRLFPLPPGSEIDAAVERYREALAGPQDVLDSGNPDGQWLYRTLIAPVQTLLPQGAKVVVIPDSSLNNLNFETLIVSEPKLHYWIEDATIADASSLHVLAASYFSQRKRVRRLLLVGDSAAPSKEYPELPKAAIQMDSVARHFPAGERRILSRAQATPAAYLASHPEQFSHIHFVAHGTANRLSPLDSAIVLSKSSTENDSFKLYARDIIRRPLRANLVTISACYGAGERSYAGEGLVGLSWAFLRAGAHNVIAALWEAADTSTEKLMAQFYEELDHGASPNTALRTAKLSLLHSSEFRNPFYWAPFQLYTQGRTEDSPYAENSPTTRKTGTVERQSRSRPSTSTRAPG
jgi:CHAT domain-containing protein